MKMERRGSLGERSLPGDRQGMSGAGAGHDSMRTVGGRALRRRAPVMQETTAPPQPQAAHDGQTQTRAQPAEGAAQETQPALTQAGLPRQRLKWTPAMNESIMRIFFKVTNLGQQMIGYRQQLHVEFCRKYPDMNVTEQRVADQYRVILRNNLIPETRINSIKREIAAEITEEQVLNEVRENLQDNPIRERAQAEANIDPPDQIPLPEVEINQELLTEDQNNEHNEDVHAKFCTEFRKAIAEYDGTNPSTRPALPRVNSSRKLAILLDAANLIIPDYILTATTLEQLHLIIYCAATAIIKTLGIKIPLNQQINARNERPTPPWERRLLKKIEDIRKDIGRLKEYIGGIRTRKVQKRVEEIMRQAQQHTQQDPQNCTPEQCLDTLKQKLSVFSGRLKRYKSSNKRKQENSLFERSEKLFYRKLNDTAPTNPRNNIYPTKDNIEEFWGTQLATPGECNLETEWLDEERAKCQTFDQMAFLPFSVDEVTNVIKKLHNWKAPGPDHVQNYWIKKLYSIHQRLTDLLNDVLMNPQNMPNFLTEGTTYLLSKDLLNTQDPAKYRPITCLPTLYKLITSCITERIYRHCDQNSIIAVQQTGCTRGAMGCKEQLIIDSVVCNQAFNNKRNLFAAYIDYRKAFDAVPHKWLINVLKLYKIDNHMISFLESTMASWRTSIKLQVPGGNCIETNSIPIRRGIFQGDSLSPLWFCLAMNPLSSQLNSTRYGFALKNNNREVTRLNHLLYMDDLKLLEATRNQLEQMLKIVEEFSGDIGMTFGLDKCRIVNIIKGKLQPGDFQIEDGQIINAMDEEESYKYLGMKQAQRIDHRTIKNEMTTRFFTRMRRLLKTNLNSRNLFKAINTYGVSSLTYSFGIVGWTKTDIDNLQRKARTLLTKANKHHPRSAVERTTLPRRMGGRGMADIGKQLAQQISNLRSFFLRKAETSEIHRAVCEADDSTPLKLQEPELPIHQSTEQEKMQTWIGKPLHGRHANEVQQEYVDIAASNYWLTSGQLFPETEGFLVAIQDQVIPTRNYLKFVVGDPTVRSDRCRYGCETTESIQHVTGGCQTFAPTEYKERHDLVAKILHQELAEKLNLLGAAKVPYYNYSPAPVLENEQHKLYWDRTVLTDQRVSNNRPDLILIDKISRKTTLIDVAIPNNNNLRAKQNEKITKYRDLEHRIRRQWEMREVRTIPIIVSTTGVIPKSLIENIKLLNLNENIYKLMQKSALLSTSRIVRKFIGNAENAN